MWENLCFYSFSSWLCNVCVTLYSLQYWNLLLQYSMKQSVNRFKLLLFVFLVLKLLYLGREYPKGSVYFRERLKSAFLKNRDVTDPEKIQKLIHRGEFVIKELEALYFLRKYRAMKKRYYEPEHWCYHVYTIGQMLHTVAEKECINITKMFYCAETKKLFVAYPFSILRWI